MRLQLRHLLLSWAVSCASTIALAPPAQAQSFFQKLFGFGGSSSAPPSTSGPIRSVPAYRFRHHGEQRWQPREEAPEQDEIGPPDSGGPYRTMCVRACDGFYFPLRHDARRRNFSSDVTSCRSACGDEARLFYYPENGGGIDTMTDLAGRAYKDMPQAFAYRKALVSGCTCKPAPWSREEAARHRSYAVAEAEAKQASPVQPTAASTPEAQSQAAPEPAPAAASLANAGNDDTSTPDAPTEAVQAPITATPGEPAAGEETARVLISETVSEPAGNPAIRLPAPRRAERLYRRKPKARFARARYVPGSSGIFGKPKSGLIWPGD